MSPVQEKFNLECLAFNPTSWNELSQTAQFLRAHYLSLHLSSADDITDFFDDPELSQPAADRLGEIISEHLPTFKKLYGMADWVYLGAKSIALDENTDSFLTERDKMQRINDAFITGHLLNHFVHCARTITSATTLFQSQQMQADITQGKHTASEDLFDGSIKILDQAGAMMDFLRAKPEIATRVVQEELGVLRSELRETIIAVLKLEPIT
ncbi:MAG: hypothetical protein WAO98_10030 [Alphaproteobacteria bacterium]